MDRDINLTDVVVISACVSTMMIGLVGIAHEMYKSPSVRGKKKETEEKKDTSK